jgi:hypothetical protein
MKKTFEEWLVANGYDQAKLSEAQKKHLMAAYNVETSPPEKPKVDEQTDYARHVAFIEEQNRRIAYFQTATSAALKTAVGNAERCAQYRQLCETALAEVQAAKSITDLRTDTKDFDLGIMRIGRLLAPMVIAPTSAAPTDDVLEATICMQYRLKDVEKAYPERTLEAAGKQMRRGGMGLKPLMLAGAKAAGYSGPENDFPAVCRAILRSRDAHLDGMRADVGPSTGIQVPGILSNIANKFLTAAFMFVDQSWRGIAKIRPVNDFKQVTTYRMAGNNTFLRVAPSGEIKHGQLSETSYTNQAKTYGRMLGISREDYINDDLGAFVSVSQELGRGGADGLNNIFWATWLDDSAFFNTDKSKLNYDDGATDSVLSIAGLDNAESIFAVQTKPDGTFLGATLRILLVPAALKNTALQLMASPNLVVGTTPASGPMANVFAGRYTVVASPFLASTSLKDENGVSQTVTGSSSAWYLLADPMDIAAIEVCFLNGKDTPTIETGEFEFNTLGFATRGYYDFGVNKQEYRAGIKLKGSA